METVALTTSSFGTSAVAATEKRGSITCLSYAPPCNLNVRHLASFHKQSHLFTKSPTCLFRYTKSHASRSSHGIFLPHLVASLEQVQQTYIMVKPDGVQRGLEHYKDLKAKPFYPKLIDYITSGPVVCMAWEGVGVVLSARKLIGSTDPLQAEPGTIRGDLAVQTGRNVVHGSDSPENGKRETALWFKEGELCQWTPAQAPWLQE
ncbi:nucleoside diphosphate kinase 2, chloroplastic-like isoform X2 [Durio zibethinus]|uniref:Nucleoside diphosphate kinase n=1 Tax=Durio zibethinus TaxID=66656 RepID=A0A6P5YEL8_DURZI|nr:nucleoside diphosphate kinase 2, chloroplastic-like isoform X2 [Durio zibethinus]